MQIPQRVAEVGTRSKLLDAIFHGRTAVPRIRPENLPYRPPFEASIMDRHGTKPSQLVPGLIPKLITQQLRYTGFTPFKFEPTGDQNAESESAASEGEEDVADAAGTATFERNLEPDATTGTFIFETPASGPVTRALKRSNAVVFGSSQLQSPPPTLSTSMEVDGEPQPHKPNLFY